MNPNESQIPTAHTVPLSHEQAMAHLQSAAFIDQLAKHFSRLSNLELAALDPLPGPLKEAFAGGELGMILDAQLQPVCLRHVVALAAVRSPMTESMRLVYLLGRAENDEQKKPLLDKIAQLKGTVQDTVVALFILTSAGAELRELTVTQIQSLAVRKFGDKVHSLLDWEKINSQLGTHYRSGFSTRLGFIRKQPAPGAGATTYQATDAEDGVGLALSLCALMMREYHMNMTEVFDEVPLNHLFAYEAAYLHTLPWLEFDERGGYVARESEARKTATP